MKIIPNEGQVLIKKDDIKMSSGGIALPSGNTKSPVIRGIVVSVGEGVTLHNGQKMKNFVKPGDVVLFPKDASIQVPVVETDLYMCVEATIVCKLEE